MTKRGSSKEGKAKKASNNHSLLEGEKATPSLPVTHFDLEDPDDVARLRDASFLLKSLEGLIIIDEIQRQPSLFPLLRILADQKEKRRCFLILGSAAPELLQNASESLAGRVTFLEVQGFSLAEIGGLPPNSWERGSQNEEGLGLLDMASGDFCEEYRRCHRRWLRGGFPVSFLAPTLSLSQEWRANVIRTYLEQDIPQLGIQVPSRTLRRFWGMMAHYHGQTWNSSQLARSLGLTDKTIARYLDILEGTLMSFRLLPWSQNLKKREVKAPKVYLYDTGLLHALLQIEDLDQLLAHPQSGASWEGLIITELIQRYQLAPAERFYWRLHSGAELDLLVFRNRKRLGFEVKLTNSPQVTPSMRSALKELGLDCLTIIHHGSQPLDQLSEKVVAVSALELLREKGPDSYL